MAFFSAISARSLSARSVFSDPKPEDAMSFTKTSIATLAVAGFVAGAVSASACEWQVNAKASTPAAEEPAQTAATPVDPMILARTEARDDDVQIEQE